MARLLQSSFGTLVGLDGNVGSRGGNLRSDVAAVQFALLLLSSGVVTPLGMKAGGLSVPGQGTIVVDGFFGPQTAAYISAYQTGRVKAPGLGGAALPPPDGNFGNFRRTAWSLEVLRRDVESKFGDFIARMRTDPRSPIFLREAFFF